MTIAETYFPRVADHMAHDPWAAIWPDLVKGLPAAFVALVIGLVAACIAFRQYRVARAKLKMDLFDKRFRIFHETWVILSETVRSGTREKNTG